MIAYLKSYLPIFLRDIHEGHLSLKHADNGQSNFVAKIKSSDKGNKQLKNCLINSGLLFSARENVLNNFKRRLSPIKKLDKIPVHESTLKPENELNTKHLN